MSWYLVGLRKYATFSGRARRKEFWFFTLVDRLVFIGLIGLAAAAAAASDRAGREGFADVLHQGMIGVLFLYWAVSLLPNIAVQARRLHDTGRSGWYMLLGFIPFIGPFVLLVFLCTEGSYGPNEHGPDPKQPAHPLVPQYA
jgi:uncharacterized membrane protein YhaH (DUF805 family)